MTSEAVLLPTQTKPSSPSPSPSTSTSTSTIWSRLHHVFESAE